MHKSIKSFREISEEMTNTIRTIVVSQYRRSSIISTHEQRQYCMKKCFSDHEEITSTKYMLCFIKCINNEEV
jgi:hypothetical protein